MSCSGEKKTFNIQDCGCGCNGKKPGKKTFLLR